MTAKEVNQDSMTEAETAKAMGISVNTLRNRIYAGANHPPFLPGPEKRFPIDEFIKWRKSRLVREKRAS